MILARIIALGMVLTSVSLAEDNPVAGVWRLNAAQSSPDAAKLPGVQNGGLRIRKEIFTGGKSTAQNPSQPAPAKPGLVLKVDLASDGQKLILTSPDGTSKGVFLRD